MQTQPFSSHRSKMFDPSHVYDRILVPIDLHETSHSGIRAALDLKRSYGSKVVLFYVANDQARSDVLGGNGSTWTLADVCEQGQSRLRMMMENVSPGDVDAVEYDVVGSVDVVEGVLSAANRHNATLVMLAVDADSEHSHVLRSRSEKIAQALNCTVMMVHPHQPTEKIER